MEIRRIPDWDGTKESTELYHHGIKGQRWGVRRYQNPDGSLTAAGKSHYYRTRHFQKLKANSIQSNVDRAVLVNRMRDKVKNANTKTGFTGAFNNRTIGLDLSIASYLSGLEKYRKDPKKYQKKVNDIIQKLDESGVKIEATDVTKRWPLGENNTVYYPGTYYSFKKKRKE